MSGRFQENDIRPAEFATRQQAAMRADIDYLLSFQQEFVAVPCPACAERCPELEFEKYALTYQRCLNCRSLYISPRPRPDHLELFYQNTQNYAFWNQYIFPASEVARRERIFRPRAARVREICERLRVTPERLVEVGAAFGTFCEEIAKLGFVQEIIAVEPTPDLAQTCRDKGLNIIEQPIEKVALPDESLDVVCAFEVLEHLFSPADFLHKLHRLLKPGGLVVLTNPSCDGLDVVVSPQHSSTVDAEHLNYLNPSSMAVLFRRTGFELLEVTTPGQLDVELVRKMFLEQQLKRPDHPFLYQVLVDHWESSGARFQSFLAENLLSSHMWTVARKSLAPPVQE